jgi:hypothetical protein
LRWCFPYVIERQPEDHALGRTLMRPAAEARVIGPEGQVGQRVYALIDSGSDYTLAAPWMAMEVGIDINEGRETRVQVGGRARPIRVLEATLRLCAPPGLEHHECDEKNSLTWTAEVGFFESWEAPPWLLILGQIGFFDRFTVTLSRFAQAVAVEPQGRFDQRFGDIPPGPSMAGPSQPRF